MNKLTPEQIAERRAQLEASPQYQLHRKQSELRRNLNNLKALDYKNHKYQEYEAADKLSELGYTLLDIYNEKEPIRVRIRELEAEIEALRQQIMAEREGEQNA